MQFRRCVLPLLIAAALIAVAPRPAQASVDDALRALQQNDYATAMPLLREAADAGNPHAQALMGQILLNGRSGVTDPAQAAAWFQKVAAGTSRFAAFAQYNLAALYWNGRGVPKDPAASLRLYEQSARNGFAEAQGLLVGAYYRGDFGVKNLVQSLKWALVVEAGGDPRGKTVADSLRREAAPDQISAAVAEARALFPRMKIADAAAPLGGAVPLRLEEQKGLPKEPVSPSAGFTKDFEALHRRPLTENAVLVPQLKANLATLPTPYIFELARRTFVDDKPEGVTLFWLARLRAIYDATRCTDGTAAQGILQWNAIVGDVLRYIGENPEVSRTSKLAAIQRESALPANTSPQWICVHGIKAVLAASRGQPMENWLKPEADWPEPRQSARDQMTQSTRQ